MRPGCSAGQRPNSIPAWANGPGSCGIFKGRAEGPVHSEVGRTFSPPPGGRRFPGALPQAVTGPRRWRSNRPAFGSSWAPPALRLLRLLRFFAANFPNSFTADHADIADKKLASVLSVSSCEIRPPSVRLLPTLCPSSVTSVTNSGVRMRANGPTPFQPGPTAQGHGVFSEGGLKARFIPRWGGPSVLRLAAGDVLGRCPRL